MNAFGIVTVPEYDRKNNGKHQCITCECKPGTLPVGDTIQREMIYYQPCSISATHGTYAIGHEHEQALGAGPDAGR